MYAIRSYYESNGVAAKEIAKRIQSLIRITSYNVCYTKLLRPSAFFNKMPYIFDIHNIPLDYLIAFCLGVFFSITINAEAQAFVTQILGDVCPSDKSRFHFNGFRHLDIPGTMAFFITGFGWPRRVSIDASKFEHPRIYSIIILCSGPAANS